MGKKLKSEEKRRLLLFGEKVREKRWGLLPSLPIFAFAYLWYWMVGDQEGQAGALGHSGIAFKNFHRHYWQNSLFLRLAYWCFVQAARWSRDPAGQAATILHAGQVAASLGKYQQAINCFRQALKRSLATGDQAHAGYVLTHWALARLDKDKPAAKTKKYLSAAHKWLEKAIKQKPNSLYLHVWLSQNELAWAEFWLQQKRLEKAQWWIKKAKQRARRYNLAFRLKDARRLAQKIKIAKAEIGAILVTSAFTLVSLSLG